jgi:hypothetical protein
VILSLQDTRTATAALRRDGEAYLVREAGEAQLSLAAHPLHAFRPWSALAGNLPGSMVPGFSGSLLSIFGGRCLKQAAVRMPTSPLTLDPSADSNQEEGGP